MKLKLIKTHNIIIAFLLSILGFGTACSKGEVRVAYGTPSAGFKIYGKVTSEDGERIPAIRVVMLAGYTYPVSDTSFATYTNSDTCYADFYGNYQVRLTDYRGTMDFNLSFKDIDGIALKSYQAKDTIIKFVDPQFENGDGWFVGEASKEVNIELKKEGEL
ncbi:MAG: radical SAM-associated putative lipoprotein [Bacteroidetes bacterium]|nr:radical SAM-associated putative lipoprotein [Bacteroidota bacterium]